MHSTTSHWHAARSGQDPGAREALMTEHLRLVQHVARQVIRTTAGDAQFDELVSAGTIGLIQAIDRFDPSRGLAFSTFATPRIRGSVLDDLRRRDHLTRSVRRKQREMSRARDRLSAELGRTPTDEETARSIGIEIEELWRWRHDVERAAPVSIDRHVVAESKGESVEGLRIDDEGDDVEEVVNHLQEVELLREEILALKEQERLVLSLAYFEELKLHEIADLLGVTESRVSQIRSKALASLRERMAHLREA